VCYILYNISSYYFVLHIKSHYSVVIVKDLLYIDVSKTKYMHILFHIKMFHFYSILQELKIYEEDMTNKALFWRRCHHCYDITWQSRHRL